jgi:hypothetical protein
VQITNPLRIGVVQQGHSSTVRAGASKLRPHSSGAPNQSRVVSCRRASELRPQGRRQSRSGLWQWQAPPFRRASGIGPRAFADPLPLAHVSRSIAQPLYALNFGDALTQVSLPARSALARRSTPSERTARTPGSRTQARLCRDGALASGAKLPACRTEP